MARAKQIVNFVRLSEERLIAMSGLVTVGNLQHALSRLLTLAGVLTIIIYGTAGMAQILSPPAARNPATVFESVRIFDGKSPTLSAPSHVLVRGNLIEQIASTPINMAAETDVQVLSGSGRALMPGLIDMHWHVMMVRPTPAMLLSSDIGYSTLLAGVEATPTLMRGFTTVRDLGGSAFSLKRAIDEGLLPGPRIFPSGALIMITSGHGDFRQFHNLPRTIGGMLSRVEQLGGSMIAGEPGLSHASDAPEP